jgi:hypothetical protein
MFPAAVIIGHVRKKTNTSPKAEGDMATWEMLDIVTIAPPIALSLN